MPEVMSIEVDEEFDPRPPSSPFGLRGPDGRLNIGMIAGIVIAIFLVIMLIFVVAKPFASDEKAPPASKWSPKDPTKDLNYLESYPATSPMASSVQQSLEDWALYFTTGDLKNLATSFDLTGNQYAQLVALQPQIAASPEPGDPAVIDLGPIGKVSRKGNIFTVRVVVNWTKPGALEGDVKNWDIDMKTDGSLFVLNTVRETNPQDKKPIDFCGAVGVIANLDSAETFNAELGKFTGTARKDKLVEVYEMKVKAWNLLLTAVEGTDSESDVEEIVGAYELIVETGEKVTSIDEIDKVAESQDISDSQEAIGQRAEQECSKSIAEL